MVDGFGKELMLTLTRFTEKTQTTRFMMVTIVEELPKILIFLQLNEREGIIKHFYSSHMEHEKCGYINITLKAIFGSKLKLVDDVRCCWRKDLRYSSIQR